MKWVSQMKAISLLMAIKIKDGKYKIERVPPAIKEQVQEQLAKLGDD